MPVGDSVAVEYNGGTDPIIASFGGPVTLLTGASRYYHPSTTNITGAYASLGTTSTSGNVVAVVKLNGVEFVTLTVPANEHLLSLQSIAQAITPSDYLTIDVTSAGTDAEDLTVYLVVGATSGIAVVNSVSKFIIVGDLTPQVGTARWYPDRDIALSSVYFSLGTAPTASAVIDVRKNGVSIFSGAKPACSSGHKSSVIDVAASLTPSDYLTVDVFSASGADATVCIVYS